MSTNALKIILQILNTWYLINTVFMIGFGTIALASPNSVTELLPIKKGKDGKTNALVIGWTCIVCGSLLSLLQVFGIYAIAKEHAGKVRTYGTIHFVFLIFGIIRLSLKLKFGYMTVLIIYCGTIIHLSYKLAKRFREKTTDELTPPPYNSSQNYEV